MKAQGDPASLQKKSKTKEETGDKKTNEDSASAATSTSSSSATSQQYGQYYNYPSQQQYYQPQYYQHYQQFYPGYSAPSWTSAAAAASTDAGEEEEDPQNHLDKLLAKIDSSKPQTSGTKRKAGELGSGGEYVNSEILFGKEPHPEEIPPQGGLGMEAHSRPPPGTEAGNWWDSAAGGYAFQASFNKKTGRMQAAGLDESHYSYTSKAYRQMDFYFDVNKWEQEGQAKKEAPKLSKKQLERVIKEKKEKKEMNKKQWLLED